MINMLNRKMKGEGGFNMIELMVVVVIVGILAAIAVPIYGKYAKNARVTEATGKMGDILTACKAYATENDDGVASTIEWPASCAAPNFIGDCTATSNVSLYKVEAAGNLLTITATGANKLSGVTVTITCSNLSNNGNVVVSGL